MSTIKIGTFYLHRMQSIADSRYLQNECQICGWMGNWYFSSDPDQHRDCANERRDHKCLEMPESNCDHDWEYYDKEGFKVCTYENCEIKVSYTDEELRDAKINLSFSDGSGCV